MRTLTFAFALIALALPSTVGATPPSPKARGTTPTAGKTRKPPASPPTAATSPSIDSPPPASSASSETTASPTPTKETEPELRSVAVTLSPLHVLVGVAEVAFEGRLARKFGLGGILGGGSYGPPPWAQSASGRTPVLEIGLSPRYYVIGTFDHGMQLGAEGLVVAAWASSGSTSATAVGVGVAPYVGYKFTAPIGFVVEVQAGGGYTFAVAQASSGSSAASQGAYFLLNLNAGWAF